MIDRTPDVGLDLVIGDFSMKVRAGLGAVLSIPLLVACGANQHEVDVVARKVADSDGPLAVPVNTDEAACRSRVLLESGLSKKAKAAVLRGEAPVLKSKRDSEAMRQAADRIARDCG